eukprot:13337242-Heterocapsa_arctica.AAC.1
MVDLDLASGRGSEHDVELLPQAPRGTRQRYPHQHTPSDAHAYLLRALDHDNIAIARGCNADDPFRRYPDEDIRHKINLLVLLTSLSHALQIQKRKGAQHHDHAAPAHTRPTDPAQACRLGTSKSYPSESCSTETVSTVGTSGLRG